MRVLDPGKRGEGVSFLFFLFLTYLVFLYLRPVELFAQWLADYRPMLFIWLIVFAGSLAHVLVHKDAAATARHYWVLFFLMLAVFLSLAVQGRLGDALSAMADFSASLLLFVLISFNVPNMSRLRITCLVISVCLLILALAGINAYYTGYMSEELVMQQGTYDFSVDAPKVRPPIPAEDHSGAFRWRVRGVGFLNDPNDFGQALVMTIPMLWLFVREGAWFRNIFLVGLPSLIMGYCIILTNSRGALIGVGCLLFFGARSKLGNFKTIVLVGVAALVFAVIGATGGREMSSKERSAEERIEAWVEGFNMLKSSPLFGVGYGGFLDRYYLTAHNSFVLGFAELGVFGYFFWMALLVLGFTAVNRVVRYAPAGSMESRAGHILRSSLVGYMACAWFLSRTYQPVLFCLLALCAASWVAACRSPACAGISELHAPLKFFKNTCLMVLVSIAAVRAFILIHFL
ncbi:MAG: O-antigen ligase family protein [Aquabacterium sp.]|nr:O-antigen ligase family protein [Aquabacterium sp.]